MINRKSVFRVAVAAADASAGLGLLVFSASAYGGSPALAVLGLLYFMTGSRVLAYLRLGGFLAAIGLLTAGTLAALAWAGFTPRQTAPLSAVLGALFVANILYAFRLAAPRL